MDQSEEKKTEENKEQQKPQQQRREQKPKKEKPAAKPAQAALKKGEDLGITTHREDNFSEWFIQVLTKAELIDYTDISGCYVFRPNSYAIWEYIQALFDSRIKKDGVKNAYFPCFVSERALKAEEDNFEGFCPEVSECHFQTFFSDLCRLPGLQNLETVNSNNQSLFVQLLKLSCTQCLKNGFVLTVISHFVSINGVTLSVGK